MIKQQTKLRSMQDITSILKPGEKLIYSLTNAQELVSKTMGTLSCTNTRVYFSSTATSIPLSSIAGTHMPSPNLLFIHTLSVHQYLSPSATHFHTLLLQIMSQYREAYPYRSLCIRSPTVVDEGGEVRVLPGESIVLRRDGVCNVACDQGK